MTQTEGDAISRVTWMLRFIRLFEKQTGYQALPAGVLQGKSRVMRFAGVLSGDTRVRLRASPYRVNWKLRSCSWLAQRSKKPNRW